MLQQATSTITCGQNSFSWFPSNESWAERIKCVADFCWKERRISFGLWAGFVLKREQVYFVRYFKSLPHPLTLYGATSFNRQQTRTKSARQLGWFSLFGSRNIFGHHFHLFVPEIFTRMLTASLCTLWLRNQISKILLILTVWITNDKIGLHPKIF